MSSLTKEEKFECLKDAVSAHGSKKQTKRWFQKWMADYYHEYGLQGSPHGYSLMEKAFELCFGEDDGKSPLANAKRDHRISDIDFPAVEERVDYDRYMDKYARRWEKEDMFNFKNSGFYPYKIKLRVLSSEQFQLHNCEDSNFKNLPRSLFRNAESNRPFDNYLIGLLNVEEKLVGGVMYVSFDDKDNAEEFQQVMGENCKNLENVGIFPPRYTNGYLFEVR